MSPRRSESSASASARSVHPTSRRGTQERLSEHNIAAGVVPAGRTRQHSIMAERPGASPVRPSPPKCCCAGTHPAGRSRVRRHGVLSFQNIDLGRFRADGRKGHKQSVYRQGKPFFEHNDESAGFLALCPTWKARSSPIPCAHAERDTMRHLFADYARNRPILLGGWPRIRPSPSAPSHMLADSHSYVGSVTRHESTPQHSTCIQ